MNIDDFRFILCEDMTDAYEMIPTIDGIPDGIPLIDGVVFSSNMRDISNPYILQRRAYFFLKNIIETFDLKHRLGDKKFHVYVTVENITMLLIAFLKAFKEQIACDERGIYPLILHYYNKDTGYQTFKNLRGIEHEKD